MADMLSSFNSVRNLTVVVQQPVLEEDEDNAFRQPNQFPPESPSILDNEMAVYSIARSVSSPRLKWLKIIDEVEPKEPNIFVDTKNSFETGARGLGNTTIHWQIDCATTPMAMTNILRTEVIEGHRLGRLLSSLGGKTPDGGTDGLLDSIYELVEGLQKKAIAALKGDRKKKRGFGQGAPLVDTLGFGDI